MSRFTVKLSIQLSDSKGSDGPVLCLYRFSFFMPRGDDYVVNGRASVLVAAATDSLSLDFVTGDDAKLVSIYAMAATDSAGSGLRVELGSVQFKDVPSWDDMADLRDALQQAFFEALRVAESAKATATAAAVIFTQDDAKSVSVPVVQAAAAKGFLRFRRLFSRRNIVVIGLLAGTSLVAYGLVLNQKPKDVNPIAAALQGDNYADLQAKIRAQIASAAKSDSPLVSGDGQALGGQNVAIDTMRAMGLDPGKANAGCLVGVK